MPQITLSKAEPHTSPAKTVNVQMKSWTEETGGPNGNRTYDENTWNFTRLGKLENITQAELKEILGEGSIIAIFSLTAN